MFMREYLCFCVRQCHCIFVHVFVVICLRTWCKSAYVPASACAPGASVPRLQCADWARVWPRAGGGGGSGAVFAKRF